MVILKYLFCIAHFLHRFYCWCSKSKDFVFKISGDQEFRLFSYNELKAATTGFKSSNKIGQGGFGSVFKVIHHAFVHVLFRSCSALC